MTITPDPAEAGAMGWAVDLPGDRLDHVELICSACGVIETVPARFMGDRVRQLQEARRRGWTFPRHHGDRQCPCCAISRLLLERGLWSPPGRRIELEPLRSPFERTVPVLRQLPLEVEAAIGTAAAFLAAEPVRRARTRPAAPQLDLFDP